MFFQHDFEKFVVGRIVLGDQQGWLPGIRTGRLRGALNGFGCRTGCGDASGGQPEPERRSFSIHGSDADLAAQPFDDALADGKTQSGAFCFCVELDEPPEYVVYFVGRDAATGIFHVKIPTVVRQLAVAEMDMALPGKFRCLVDEVVHHLRQAPPVGVDRAARHAFLTGNFYGRIGYFHAGGTF